MGRPKKVVKQDVGMPLMFKDNIHTRPDFIDRLAVVRGEVATNIVNLAKALEVLEANGDYSKTIVQDYDEFEKLFGKSKTFKMRIAYIKSCLKDKNERFAPAKVQIKEHESKVYIWLRP